MTRTRLRPLILFCSMLGIAAEVHAQQPPAPAAVPRAADAPAPAAAAPAAAPVTTAPAAAAASSTAVPKAADAPSPEVLKKAKEAGYHTRIKHGDVLYCKDEAVIGTRFKEEHCLTENQLEQTLVQDQQQRDQLQHNIGSGTSNR